MVCNYKLAQQREQDGVARRERISRIVQSVAIGMDCTNDGACAMTVPALKRPDLQGEAHWTLQPNSKLLHNMMNERFFQPKLKFLHNMMNHASAPTPTQHDERKDFSAHIRTQNNVRTIFDLKGARNTNCVCRTISDPLGFSAQAKNVARR